MLGRDSDAGRRHSAQTAAALLHSWGPLTVELVADIVAAAADQLDAWAGDGLVYGTVQPDQIELILDSDRLIEARLRGFPSSAEILSPTLLLFNARYVDPAVLGDAAFGPGADVYALACAAFELLTGTAPFAGGKVAEMMERASGGVVPTTDLPGDLGVVLATALAPDPRHRYETAGDFATALRRAAGNLELPG